ncbi:MAG: Rrf2 family transcriptional regulator [Lachnospiraceae bacterium]|nr:Rrf2 family transcriptional regulator [Lachnospiraceae bacterium]
MTSEFSVAVHALVFLNHKAEVVSSENLAQNVCTNAARIRKVMAKLKKAGLVETKEGIEGGYIFRQNSQDVNLCMIAEALEAAFVSTSWKSGNVEMDCLIASGMAGVLSDVYADLDRICHEKVRGITIADLDRKIFGQG